MKDGATNYKYDVALSFAGEQRVYVERVAAALKQYKVRCFYDNDNQVDLWGKNLIKYLSDIYFKQSKYCVIFISKSYCEKDWTILESEAAEERNFLAHDSETYQQYILPVRFDNNEIPGLRSSWGYIDANKVSPEELAEIIAQKVSPSYVPSIGTQPHDYLEYTFDHIVRQLEAYFNAILDSRYTFSAEHLEGLWIGTYLYRGEPIYCLSIKILKLTNQINELLIYNGSFRPKDFETCFTARVRQQKNNQTAPLVFYNHGFDMDELIRNYSAEMLSTHLISEISKRMPNIRS